MATATIFPDADVTTANWTSTGANFYTEIDEGTGTPSDADYVQTTVADAILEVGLQDTPPNLGTLTQITFPFRGYLDDGSATAFFRCSLWRSGPFQVGGDIDIDGIDFGGYGTTPATIASTVQWLGLSLTKAQADTLQFRVQFKTA